jgi:hypothetical protein
VFDFASAKPDSLPEEIAALFEPLDAQRHDVLIGFGWGMAEDLASRYTS